MSDAPGIVVVGASLAGLRGAEALRKGGHEGSLTIVGDEPHRPYDRPPLSKHVLAGELAPDATGLPQLVKLGAQWRLGQAAIGLDRAAKTIRLAGGGTLAFEKLLIATGAQARSFPGEGGDLAGVFTMRSRDDAASLREALVKKPGRVLIIGGGLIGCEAASCFRSLGLPVTLVDPNPTPLARALGTLVGATLVGCMKDAGVDFRPSTHVQALDGEGGQVVRARLKEGGTIEADLVVAALGAARATGWLSEAGLMADDGGVRCDGTCRVLDAEGNAVPDIYAAGDVARWPSPLYEGRPVAVEHWGNAVEQAGHAARNMLAAPDAQDVYDHLPSFWSSQFGLNIKMAGIADGADALAIVQGSRGSRRYLAVYGRAGRTIAAVSFDEARWLPAYAERIAARATFPPILDASDQARIQVLPPGFPAPRPAREPERSQAAKAAPEPAHA